MATTVEATTRDQAPVPPATVPWYRERRRQLLAALVLLAAAAIVGWFVLASSKRKEQFAARSLNQVRMVNGQSELAVVGLREYLASKPAEKYMAPAYGLLGAALENSKRWAEAAQAYTQASNAAELDYLKASYLVDAGRAYREAGKIQDAERAYRTVLQKYAKSPRFTEAQVRLAELTDGKM